jgi:hypothetical protein
MDGRRQMDTMQEKTDGREKTDGGKTDGQENADERENTDERGVSYLDNVAQPKRDDENAEDNRIIHDDVDGIKMLTSALELSSIPSPDWLRG